MIKDKTLEIVNIAMMVVVISICSWITVPFMVPFTLQTFGVFLSLKLLGGKNGTKAIALYILLGIIGLPIFSGFNAGIGHITGPTGGYIMGFLLTGLTYWILKRSPKICINDLFIMFFSLLPCYLFGTIWFAAVYGCCGKTIGVLQIISICIVPFIIPDIFKILLADVVSKKVKKVAYKNYPISF